MAWMIDDDSTEPTAATWETAATAETGHVDPEGAMAAASADPPPSSSIGPLIRPPVAGGHPGLELPARYRRPELLGRGGMGEVWRVDDTALRRAVAMKLIHRRLCDSTRAVDRFREEAQVTAQLEHPRIVPVYDVGTLADGRLYYTMKEVTGRTLARVIADARDLDDRLALVETLRDVAEAVGYAHDRGVLHRDLKPLNILVGDFGETLVLDWGLAKVLGTTDDRSETAPLLTDRAESTDSQTRHGQVSGTRGFMSPEQREGRLDDIGPPADVYALGAILLQLLTGRYPATRPELGDLTGPDPLVSLCRQALADDAHARPRDAAVFGARLTDWISGHQRQRRARQWLDTAEALADDEPDLRELALRGMDTRGQPRAFARAGLDEAGLGPALGRLVAGGFLVERDDGHVQFSEPERVAEWPLLTAWRSADGAVRPMLADVSARWQLEGRPDRLLWLGERHAELARWLERAEPRLTPVERAFADASAAATMRAARRRRRLLVGAVATLLAAVAALAILLVQAVTAREAADRARDAEQAARLEAETRAAVAAAERSAARGHPFAELARYRAAQALADDDARPAIDAELARLAAIGDRGAFLRAHSGIAVQLLVTADSRRALTGGTDGAVHLWDLERGERLYSEQAHAGVVDFLGLSPDERWAVTIGQDTTSRLWDLREKRLRAELPMDGGLRTMRATFSPDSARVVTSAMNHTLAIWSTADGRRLGTIPSKQGGHEMAFSPDGTRFATVAWWGGPIRVHDGGFEGLRATAKLGVDPTWVRFAPDGRTFTVAGWGGLGRFDTETGERLMTVQGIDAKAPVADIGTTAYGELVFRQAGAVLVADPETGVIAQRVEGKESFTNMDRSRDGRWVATGDARGRVALWRTGVWEPVVRFGGHHGAVRQIAFTPDGRGIVVGSTDGAVWLLRPAALRHRPLECGGRPGALVDVARSAGVVLVAADDGSATCMIDARGEARRVPAGGPGVTPRTIDDHGRHALLHHRADAVVLVVDLERLEVVTRLPWPHTNPLSASFSPDGQHVFLAVGDPDGRPGNMQSIHAFSLDGRPLGETTFPRHGGGWHRKLDGPWIIDYTPNGADTRTSSALTGEVLDPMPPGVDDARAANYDASPRVHRIAEYWRSDGIRIYDVAAHAPVSYIPMPRDRVRSLALGDDGRRVAIGDESGRIDVWAADDARSLFSAEMGAAAHRVAISPDEALVAASAAGETRVWSIDAGRLLRVIPRGTRVPHAIEFAGPDHLVVGRGTSAYVVEVRSPPPDPAALTNLRACRSDLSVVPVAPFDADLVDGSAPVWADPEACDGG